jgi:hypothetical protein
MQISIPTAVVVCALAFAACGADDPAAESDGDRRQDNEDAMLAYAQCMRDEGVDMPDPKPGERGIQLRAPGGSEAKVRAADEACREHLEKIDPPDISEEDQAEFRESALAHAQCMRDHGIDMPDPTFSADGGAQMRIRRGSGIDPESAKFREAEEACRDELPDGGPRREESSP